MVDSKTREAYIKSSIGIKILNKDFLNWLVNSNYYDAPASMIEERCYRGALYDHSKNVTKQLLDLTKKLNLKWDRKQSPYIIGMFHDISKLEEYFIYSYHPYTVNLKKNPNEDGHGDRSVNILLEHNIELTEQEEYCIRYHQGAFVSKNKWDEYTDAIRKHPNILYVHTADMIASQIIELSNLKSQSTSVNVYIYERERERRMTKEEIIDGLEIYTVGRPNRAIVCITVEELQKFIDGIKDLKQEPCDKSRIGYWIFDDKCKEHGHCPRCRYGSVDLADGESHNYCPNCGARLIIE